MVTKRDLWNDRAAEVERFYRHGGYAKALSGLLVDPKVRLETAFCSLRINRLQVGSEVLAPNVADFDETDRDVSKFQFWRTFDDLRRWERDR